LMMWTPRTILVEELRREAQRNQYVLIDTADSDSPLLRLDQVPNPRMPKHASATAQIIEFRNHFGLVINGTEWTSSDSLRSGEYWVQCLGKSSPRLAFSSLRYRQASTARDMILLVHLQAPECELGGGHRPVG
jgi:hypothetical protein